VTKAAQESRAVSPPASALLHSSRQRVPGRRDLGFLTRYPEGRSKAGSSADRGRSDVVEEGLDVASPDWLGTMDAKVVARG